MAVVICKIPRRPSEEPEEKVYTWDYYGYIEEDPDGDGIYDTKPDFSNHVGTIQSTNPGAYTHNGLSELKGVIYYFIL
jgi:hypothetical protein